MVMNDKLDKMLKNQKADDRLAILAFLAGFAGEYEKSCNVKLPIKEIVNKLEEKLGIYLFKENKEIDKRPFVLYPLLGIGFAKEVIYERGCIEKDKEENISPEDIYILSERIYENIVLLNKNKDKIRIYFDDNSLIEDLDKLYK
ncbi:MAG: hypothetical protein RXQ77_01930 [Candidatus Nanopusillus sp.]